MRRHGRALATITAISVLGIFATAGFQVVASRGLGPEQFGLVAALLALINVASIGSSALRNAVAVNVASISVPSNGRERDPSLIEAFLLGGLAVVALTVASPWMLPGAGVPALALILTISCFIPYFLFARAQGILQGVGRATSVIWWSTGAQLLQLALALVVIAIGAGVVGVLVAVFVTAVVGTIGSTVQARRVGLAPRGRAFTRESLIVLYLTILFAWLTNSDVIFVRIWGELGDAGNYAAAAILVKTTLILPTMLSLYLLPRFVRSRNDASATRQGVFTIVGLTLAGGLMVVLVLAVFGAVVVDVVFGSEYAQAASVLPALALSWLPWALCQAILVRVIAIASLPAVLVLMFGAMAQAAIAALTLPDVFLFIATNGCIGVLVFAGMFVVQLTRRTSTRGAEEKRSATFDA